MATKFNPQKEINKLLMLLEPEENDINKIANVTHKSLMIMSVTDAAAIINKKKKVKKEELSEEDELKLFHEIIKKSYLEKLDFMRKTLLD